MRRRFVFVLILINCLLGIALLARSADSQIIPNGPNLHSPSRKTR